MALWVLIIIGSLIIIVTELLYLRKSYFHKYENLVTRNRFRLFAIRDRFVRLVATGDLDEDDVIYKFFVSFINCLILDTQVIQLRVFIEALKEVTEKKIIMREEAIGLVFDKVSKENNEQVIDAVNEFWGVLVKILVDNSTTLRTILWIRIKFREMDILTEKRKKIKPVLEKYSEDFSLHENIDSQKNHWESLAAA